MTDKQQIDERWPKIYYPMTYWRCIKCSHTNIKPRETVRFRCQCGYWCKDITEIMIEIKEKGDLTAVEINSYHERIEQRCIGTN